MGDATPPEAELGDTTGDEGESGDDGSCGVARRVALGRRRRERCRRRRVVAPRARAQGTRGAPPPPRPPRGGRCRGLAGGRCRCRARRCCIAAQQPKADEDERRLDGRPRRAKRFAAAAEVAAKAQADRLGERVGGWEVHEKGVASKLMAKMGYVRGSGLGKNSQGRTDILPIPAPRRGTRDCENPGLGAPEAAPVEAPKDDGGPGRERSRAAYDRDSGRAAPRSVFDAVDATTRRAVAPDPKKLKEAARRKTQRDVHRSAGALRAADTAGAEALRAREAPGGPRAGQGAPSRPRRRRRVRRERDRETRTSVIRVVSLRRRGTRTCATVRRRGATATATV